MRPRRRSSPPGVSSAALRDPDRFEAWLRRLLVRACYREAGRDQRQRRIVALIRTLPSAGPDPGLDDRRPGRAGAWLRGPRPRAARAARPALLPGPPAAGDVRDPRHPCRHGEVQALSHHPAAARGARCRGAAATPLRTDDMSDRPTFDRILTAWLDEQAPTREPAGLLERVTTEVAATRRLPGWVVPERWLPMQTTARLGPGSRAVIILALLSLLIASLAAIGVGAQPSPKPDSGLPRRSGLPGTGSSPSIPVATSGSPTPTATTHATSSPDQGWTSIPPSPRTAQSSPSGRSRRRRTPSSPSTTLPTSRRSPGCSAPGRRPSW